MSTEELVNVLVSLNSGEKLSAEQVRKLALWMKTFVVTFHGV